MVSTQEALLKSVTEPAFLTPDAYRAATEKSLKERTFSLWVSGPCPNRWTARKTRTPRTLGIQLAANAALAQTEVIDQPKVDPEITTACVAPVSRSISDQPHSFQISVNFTQEPRITVIPIVQAITGLTASPYSSNGDTLTRLSWDASVEKEVTSYNIYSARDIDPYFAKITTVLFATTTFDTTDEWSSEASIPVRTYVIRAVKGDGAESFFRKKPRITTVTTMA